MSSQALCQRPIIFAGACSLQGEWRRPALLFHLTPYSVIGDNAMTRKYIDCREFPSEMNCTIALSADSDQELLDAAVQHAVSVHKHTDSPELRAQLSALFHQGTPPVDSPRTV